MTATLVIRASTLSAYADCPRRAAARSFRALVEAAGFKLRDVPPSVGAVVGTAFHAATAYTKRAKMATGNLGNANEAEQAAVQSLEEGAAPGVVWDKTTGTLGEGKHQLTRMIATYRANAAQLLMPTAVEQRLMARSGEFILSGQADECENDAIEDDKTGTRQRANGPQYGGYSLLRRSHGHPVKTATEIYTPRVRADAEQPPPLFTPYPVERCEQAAVRLMNRVAEDVAKFKETREPWSFVANPMSVLCGDKWCPAWGTAFCREHKGAT